jgi:CBS domain-containing protein
MDPLESLKGELISRLGPLTLSTLAPNDTVLDAVQLMQQSRLGCVLICDDGKVVGILTERDVLRRLGTSQPLDVPLTYAMSRTVWFLRSTETLGRALEIMDEKQCRHLAVIGPDDSPVGVLTVGQIVHALVEHFPSAVYNLPPDAKQVSTAREGA